MFIASIIFSNKYDGHLEGTTRSNQNKSMSSTAPSPPCHLKCSLLKSFFLGWKKNEWFILSKWHYYNTKGKSLSFQTFPFSIGFICLTFQQKSHTHTHTRARARLSLSLSRYVVVTWQIWSKINTVFMILKLVHHGLCKHRDPVDEEMKCEIPSLQSKIKGG